MRTSGLRAARDYNRGLIFPVRAAHLGLAAVRAAGAGPRDWSLAPQRRSWAPYLILAAAGFLLLLPIDGALSRAFRAIKLGGDFRRELEAFQQWGQGVSTILVMLAVWLGDPNRRLRLYDWAAGLASTGIVVTLVKLLVGRPRPKYDDPLVFLGPFGQYPVVRGDRPVGIYHAWDVGAPISAELWSMPSSHTAYAAVMAAALSALYPRLRPLVIGCVILVGCSRLITGAHYPSDVAVGGLLGAGFGAAAMRQRWGLRTLRALPEIGTRLNRLREVPAGVISRHHIPGPLEASRAGQRAREDAEKQASQAASPASPAPVPMAPVSASPPPDAPRAGA
jgi:membrane-associated phospholipid phosphatase